MSRGPTPRPSAVGRLLSAPSLRAAMEALDQTGAVSISGLWGSAAATVAAAIDSQLNRPILLVCGHLDEADDLADDLQLFTGRRPAILPALELSGSLGRASEEQVANRLQLLAALNHELKLAASPTADKTALPRLLIAPVQALMQSVPSTSQLDQLIRVLHPGLTLEIEKLISWLSDHGYNRLEQVEVPGDFAVRGGIVDIYIPGDFETAGAQVGLTVRVDFFGDQVESIKTFSLETLGSLTPLPQVTLLDVKGALPEATSAVSIFSYLADNAVVALWEPLEIAEQARAYLDRLPDSRGIYPLDAVLRLASRFTRLEMSQFEQGSVTFGGLLAKTSTRDDAQPQHLHLPVSSLQKFETDAKRALAELAELAATHDITVFCENDGERTRFLELLEQTSPGLPDRLATHLGYIHRGFVWDESRDAAAPPPTDTAGRPIALISHHELFHRYEMRRRAKKVIAARPVDSFLDLKVGDYVVHVAHGIAKFTGIHTIAKDGKSEEYLTLRFADDAALHVPATRINLIQKYVGGFSGHPQLSRLGSGVWEKQKAKVSDAVMDMAAELIEVQAARQAQQGFSYPVDTTWQKEFEAEFPYTPTADQLTSAEEIKQDMIRTRPMDRLLCGDVGYGKTELAMRAAFKAAETGKQVAVLVPTTVLAEQHERSFRERMANYPFRVESVSRFKSPKQAKQTLKFAAEGEVDILIGTHRLLSQDVKFKDLGLVIVDEEQRFGVTHKERLKQMRKMVDVLTMSATPIPRTLHMSLLGVRDISSLTTAPQDRRSIVTEVMGYDKNRIKLAIQRELQREGQVYFVHNRVHNITEMADEIHKLVPDARILIGHGQMGDGELEEVMLKFIRHEADILVSTTIIESGLDIPNANTIIINNADRFGLSELHQLRGRVGRYKHRAYCYLLLPPDRPVTEIAAKRLKAIEEFSHLGSGFKIAMRDLELRGAGNILGPEQSGHIATVGYEMYCQLLEEAVRQLKNEAKPITPEAHVDIGVTAFIPKTYINADRQRMDVYRRLTRCTSIAMLEELQRDTVDAFGELPRQAVVLFAMMELKLLAGLFGIESIIKKDPDAVLSVRDASRAQLALTGAPGTLRVIDPKTVYLRMPPTFTAPEALLLTLRNLMRKAYDAEQASKPGAATPAPEPAPAPNLKSQISNPPPPPPPAPTPTPAQKSQLATQKAQSKNADFEKLLTLRNQGILSEQEFQSAAQRLLKQAHVESK